MNEEERRRAEAFARAITYACAEFGASIRASDVQLMGQHFTLEACTDRVGERRGAIEPEQEPAIWVEADS